MRPGTRTRWQAREGSRHRRGRRPPPHCQALPSPAGGLYAATLGVLAGESPDNLSAGGGRFLVFGRLGVTWRVLEYLHLTAQIDARSSPYGASLLSPLSDAAVMLGFGGRLRIAERLALEIAVTEDDGAQHPAPDIGLHAAIRWWL